MVWSDELDAKILLTKEDRFITAFQLDSSTVAKIHQNNNEDYEHKYFKMCLEKACLQSEEKNSPMMQ